MLICIVDTIYNIRFIYTIYNLIYIEVLHADWDSYNTIYNLIYIKVQYADWIPIALYLNLFVEVLCHMV